MIYLSVYYLFIKEMKPIAYLKVSLSFHFKAKVKMKKFREREKGTVEILYVTGLPFWKFFLHFFPRILKIYTDSSDKLLCNSLC